MNNNELQHWGIKGMQWGRRRFQNKDGSLTPAGRERYDDDDMDDAYAQGQKDAKKEARNKRLKTVLKIGAATAVTALAIYGTKKYLDAKNAGAAEKGESALKDVLEKMKSEKKPVDAEKTTAVNNVVEKIKNIAKPTAEMNTKTSNNDKPATESKQTSDNDEPYWGKGESPFEATARKRGLSVDELTDSLKRNRDGSGNENDRKNLLALQRTMLIAQKKSSTYGDNISVGGMLAARKGMTEDEYQQSMDRARNGTGNNNDRNNLLNFEKSLRDKKTRNGMGLSVSDEVANRFGKTNNEIMNSLNKARNGSGDSTDRRILMAFESILKKRKNQ